VKKNASLPKPLAQIADYLSARREAIFNGWRTLINTDKAMLPTASSLTRDEFNDQIPIILNVLDQRLREQPDEASSLEKAKEHGLHRWHKGYTLAELLHELAHLHRLLAHELETYCSSHADVEPAIVSQAHQIIDKLMLEVTQGSAAQFDELQRQEATQRAANLQQALQSLSELTQQRGKLLRTASHDLRSYFGLMQGASWLLDQPGTEAEQAQWRSMWQRNLDNATGLLTELMDLARLEAGQEAVQIESFDAGELMRQLAQSVQPIAHQRQLTVEWTGPESLVVESDRIKVQRIVQNLLLNALTNTPSGMLSLSWSKEDNFRWIISVQDTGPGLPPDIAQQLGHYLIPTVDSTAVLQDKPTNKLFESTDSLANPALPHSKGEGIGLLIVKRLCELLHASLDIETKPGVGTLFRITMPIHHSKPE
jgi:signal transduction histidine kinase